MLSLLRPDSPGARIVRNHLAVALHNRNAHVPLLVVSYRQIQEDRTVSPFFDGAGVWWDPLPHPPSYDWPEPFCDSPLCLCTSVMTVLRYRSGTIFT